MTLNIKSNFALTIAQEALRRSAGERHGITGFWVASLHRVCNERLLRIAHMPQRVFVLEAEIDADATHIMVPERMDEYTEHERLKRAQLNRTLAIDDIRAEMNRCIDQGRLVVAFRNARAIDVHVEHTNRNPVWYTEEE